MHDLLEGVFPLQLELLLKAHTTAKHYDIFTFNMYMKFAAPIPSSDYPTAVCNDLKVAGKQTASQALSLIRSLPFFFMENLQVNQLDAHCSCIMHLIRIVQLCFSPVATSLHIAHLRKAISDHHIAFRNLYPEVFIPKLHFLIHYPDQVKNFGPLRNHMCFTFETKHQVAKNIRWFNFKNISLSIMNHAVENLAANMFLPSGDMKNDVFQHETSIRKNGLKAYNCGIHYKISDVLMFYNDAISFQQIKKFSMTPDNRLKLHVSKLKTAFMNTYNLFEVTHSEDSSYIIYADELQFPWPTLQRHTSKWFLFPISLVNLNHYYSCS
jgi:hypothetical protein